MQQMSWETEQVLSVLLAQACSGKVALSRSRPPAGTPANYAGAGRQPLGGSSRTISMTGWNDGELQKLLEYPILYI